MNKKKENKNIQCLHNDLTSHAKYGGQCAKMLEFDFKYIFL